MEANQYGFRGAAHSCSLPTNGIYYNCDKGGSCVVDVLLNIDNFDFGPGSSYKIDTEKVFNVETKFFEKNGLLDGYTTTLSQDGKSVVMAQLEC